MQLYPSSCAAPPEDLLPARLRALKWVALAKGVELTPAQLQGMTRLLHARFEAGAPRTGWWLQEWRLLLRELEDTPVVVLEEIRIPLPRARLRVLLDGAPSHPHSWMVSRPPSRRRVPRALSSPGKRAYRTST